MFLGNAILEIALISLVLVIVSQILQRKLMDKKGMKESQVLMKEKQKRIKELMGNDDSKSKLEAEKLQKEMLELMSKSMHGTMKHMVVSLPIFLGVFWFLGMTYGGMVIQLPFAVPVFHRDFSFEITSGISWFWTYFYNYLLISIILSGGLKIIGK